MNSKAAASSFSISGLLDADSQTRKRFPVAEIPVADIADHPGNATYSMEDASIAKLADSIRRDGLTDLPLVRKLPDGSYQMPLWTPPQGSLYPACRRRPRLLEAALQDHRGHLR